MSMMRENTQLGKKKNAAQAVVDKNSAAMK